MVEEPRNLLDIPVELDEIPVEEINDAGRSRKEYGDVEQLKLSIQQKGLIHPIAVSKYDEPYEGFKYFLLVGGRRLAAVRQLELEKVPARIYPSNLNSYEVRSIELEENIRRKDLTDAERIMSIKEVHDLYVSIYGEKKSTSKGAKGHSQKDTANMLGVSTATVSLDIEMAEWIEEIPELAKLGDRKKIKQAITIAKKRGRRKIAFEAAGVEKPDATVQGLEDAYNIGDFFTYAKTIPDGTIDLVDLDIDYPMEIDENILHSTIKLEKKNGTYVGISKKDYPGMMKKALVESYRILNEDGWCLIWFGREYFQRLQDWGKEVGFKTSWYTGKWYKGDGFSHCRNPRLNLQHSMEEFFYFKKGSPQIVYPHSDVFQHKPTPPSEKIHPYEKPVALMQEIFETFLMKESRIAVPFAGSGNSLVSGFQHGCYVTGYDLSEEYKKLFVLKIRSLKMEGKLTDV